MDFIKKLFACLISSFIYFFAITYHNYASVDQKTTIVCICLFMFIGFLLIFLHEIGKPKYN